MFTVTKIGHAEDDSFRVANNRTGRAIIVACTGNGGETAYELNEVRSTGQANRYVDFSRNFILGYAPTHAEAERRAKLILRRG